MKIREGIKESLEAYLKENNIHYFIGGSERFGWSNNESDIDIFVCCGVNELRDIFQEFPTRAIIAAPQPPYVDLEKQYTLLGGFIHLNVFMGTGSNTRFNILKEQHEKIEKILNKNTELKRVISYLKCKNVHSGRDIYRALKQLPIKS